MNAHECCQYDFVVVCYVLQITFTAKAGQPVKLEPETIPATPTVSNTQRNNSRVLVKTLKLQLKVFFINYRARKKENVNIPACP